MCVSDLICGMSSMFLIESAVLGKTIISMQMGLNRENPFILDKIGAVKSVLNKKALEDKIMKSILEYEFDNFKFEIQNGAINNVINFMEAIICQI
jgi:hypothetical protein